MGAIPPDLNAVTKAVPEEVKAGAAWKAFRVGKSADVVIPVTYALVDFTAMPKP